MIKHISLLVLFLYSSAVIAQLRIVSYNIRNYDEDFRFGRKTNKMELAKIMREAQADVFGVQEIVNFEDFEQFTRTHFPSHKLVLSDCGGSARQRLGFLYDSRTLDLEEIVQDGRIRLSSGSCNQGLRPAMIGHFRVKKTGYSFTIINVHLKAGGGREHADLRIQQYGIIGLYITELKRKGHRNVVVLGDFNSVDYMKRNHNYQAFIDFTDRYRLHDFAPETGCTAYWWGGKSDGYDYPNIIDHVLVTPDFYNNFRRHVGESLAHCRAARCDVTKREELGVSYSNVSDHCPLVLTSK